MNVADYQCGNEQVDGDPPFDNPSHTQRRRLTADLRILGLALCLTPSSFLLFAALRFVWTSDMGPSGNTVSQPGALTVLTLISSVRTQTYYVCSSEPQHDLIVTLVCRKTTEMMLVNKLYQVKCDWIAR